MPAPRRSRVAAAAVPVGFGRAALRIALADLSMSLDNVLAVAGVARDHPMVLIFGLSLSAKTQMLYRGKHVFINGESFGVGKADKATLELLANNRRLEGDEFAPLGQRDVASLEVRPAEAKVGGPLVVDRLMSHGLAVRAHPDSAD